MSFYGGIRQVYNYNVRHGEELPAQLKSENGRHKEETAKHNVRPSV